MGGLGRSLIAFGGQLVSLRVPWASKIDAAGNQADIAKTNEKQTFSKVLEGWRVILEAWRSSGLSSWHGGRQLAG